MRLLAVDKQTLVQIEIDKFERLHAREPKSDRYLWALLLAVYGADLDGERLMLGEAISLVPAQKALAKVYIHGGVEREFMRIEKNPTNRRLRTVRPGPALNELAVDPENGQRLRPRVSAHGTQWARSCSLHVRPTPAHI